MSKCSDLYSVDQLRSLRYYHHSLDNLANSSESVHKYLTASVPQTKSNESSLHSDNDELKALSMTVAGRGMHYDIHINAKVRISGVCSSNTCSFDQALKNTSFSFSFLLPDAVFVDPYELGRLWHDSRRVKLEYATVSDMESMVIGMLDKKRFWEDMPFTQIVILRFLSLSSAERESDTGFTQERQISVTMPVHMRYHAAARADENVEYRAAYIPQPLVHLCPDTATLSAEACRLLPLPTLAEPPFVELRAPISSLKYYPMVRAATDVVVLVAFFVVILAFVKVKP